MLNSLLNENKMGKNSKTRFNDQVFYSKFERNLLYFMQILMVTNKLFYLFNRILKILSVNPVFEAEKFSPKILINMRGEFKTIVLNLLKTNCILSSCSEFLNYFRFSVIDLEIKVGKLKKYFYLIIRSKNQAEKYKKHGSSIFSEENKRNIIDFEWKLGFFSNLEKKKQGKSFKKEFFLNDFFIENQGLDFPMFYSNITINRNVIRKVEIIFFFIKKWNTVSLICKKIKKSKKILLSFFLKHEKISEIEGKILLNYFNKKFLVQTRYFRNHSIPIRTEKDTLLFKINITKINIFNILLKSQFFKNFKKGAVYIWNQKKKKNPRKKNIICKINESKSMTKLKSFLKNKKNKTKIYSNDKKFSFEGENGKFLSSLSFRLTDLSRESFHLWSEKFNKIEHGRFEEIEKKRGDQLKFNRQIFLKNLQLKFLISSSRQKIRLSSSNIKRINGQKNFLMLKFQELKGMETDYKIFSEIIRDSNK